MTERQVWLKLAAGIRDDVTRGIFISGLCYHLDQLVFHRRVVSGAKAAPVRWRIEAAVERNKWGVYAWPLSSAGHARRIAFCKRQVARIDRERRRKRAR